VRRPIALLCSTLFLSHIALANNPIWQQDSYASAGTITAIPGTGTIATSTSTNIEYYQGGACSTKIDGADANAAGSKTFFVGSTYSVNAASIYTLYSNAVPITSVTGIIVKPINGSGEIFLYAGNNCLTVQCPDQNTGCTGSSSLNAALNS
jgi:hypothetical protein